MTAITVDQAVEAVDTLAGFDWQAVVTALRSGDIIGELTTVEDIAGLIAKIAPEAVYFEDAAELLILVIKARRAGLWAPASPDDPSMRRATGSRAR